MKTRQPSNMMTLQQWRNRDKEQTKPFQAPRNAEKNDSSNVDGFDFSRKLAITESFNRLVLGFDPSTHQAGVAIYDPPTDQVLEYDSMDPDLLKPWVFDMLKKYAGHPRKIFARVEMPTKSTAFGAAQDLRKKMFFAKKARKNIEEAVFGLVWSSGMCFERSRQFMRILLGVGIPFELVATETRINCSKNNLTKGKSEAALEVFFKHRIVRTGDPWQFPTKMDAKSIKYFWRDIKTAGDKDRRDALCCCFPEKIYRIMKKV